MNKPTKREMRMKLDEVTIARYQELFINGDYARISEALSTPKKKVPVKIITDAFQKGIAPQSIAMAITKFYSSKAAAKAQQQLAAQ